MDTLNSAPSYISGKVSEGIFKLKTKWATGNLLEVNISSWPIANISFNEKVSFLKFLIFRECLLSINVFSSCLLVNIDNSSNSESLNEFKRLFLSESI